MMTHELLALMAAWGWLLVFANVFLEQLGLPLPAVPTLVVAGGLAAQGRMSALLVLALALFACLLGDSAWFWAGRRFGARVLARLCRLSLAPDSCVRTSSNRFQRRGGKLLLVAKFVPGLSTLAPPLAGASGLGWRDFLLFDLLGSLLWAGLAVVLGMLFAEQVSWLIDTIEQFGALALLAIGTLLGLYIAVKWWQRMRLLRAFRMARVGAPELARMLASDDPPVVLDVRSNEIRRLDDRIIPGARLADIEALEAVLADVAPDTALVIYCACPNEVSAARAARLLLQRGFRRVRPLQGGLDAWESSGQPVLRLQALASAAVLEGRARPYFA